MIYIYIYTIDQIDREKLLKDGKSYKKKFVVFLILFLTDIIILAILVIIATMATALISIPISWIFTEKAALEFSKFIGKIIGTIGSTVYGASEITFFILWIVYLVKWTQTKNMLKIVS